MTAFLLLVWVTPVATTCFLIYRSSYCSFEQFPVFHRTMTIKDSQSNIIYQSILLSRIGWLSPRNPFSICLPLVPVKYLVVGYSSTWNLFWLHLRKFLDILSKHYSTSPKVRSPHLLFLLCMAGGFTVSEDSEQSQNSRSRRVSTSLFSNFSRLLENETKTRYADQFSRFYYVTSQQKKGMLKLNDFGYRHRWLHACSIEIGLVTSDAKCFWFSFLFQSPHQTLANLLNHQLHTWLAVKKVINMIIMISLGQLFLFLVPYYSLTNNTGLSTNTQMISVNAEALITHLGHF